jgi:hypothetical protein
VTNRVDRDVLGRLAVALMVGIAVGLLTREVAARESVTTDFEFLWRAVRLWVEGRDPYAMRPQTRDWPLGDRLFYPLPALLVVWPLHALSLPMAAAIFVAVPSGLLAWQLSRSGLWRLLALASPSLVLAAVFGQWSPWLVLGMLWPNLGFFFVCKPSLGLACLIARPTLRAVVGCAIIGLVSLVIWPRWPLGWLHNLSSVSGHPPPLRTPLGWLLLLVLLRWRQWESRLVLAMALIPQLYLFADQLPLVLVSRTRREATFMFLSSWICAGFWFVRHFARVGMVAAAEPYVMLGCYLPALWILLRRPNVGELPAWMERLRGRFLARRPDRRLPSYETPT